MYSQGKESGRGATMNRAFHVTLYLLPFDLLLSGASAPTQNVLFYLHIDVVHWPRVFHLGPDPLGPDSSCGCASQ